MERLGEEVRCQRQSADGFEHVWGELAIALMEVVEKSAKIRS